MKINIILKLFFSLLLGGCIALVVMSVLCIYYYFSKRNFTESEKKKNKTSIIVFVCVFVFFALFYVFILGFDGGGDNIPTDGQLTACRQRSNTYIKCSWSTFENECICKAR